MEEHSSLKKPHQGPFLSFDLAGEIEKLRREPYSSEGNRNATTLVKDGELRVVLGLAAPGAKLGKSHIDGPATLHILSGGFTVHGNGQAVELGSGMLLTLEAGLTYDLTATQETVYLLTILQNGVHQE